MRLYRLGWLRYRNIRYSASRQVKPDDHSEVVPLLPIPNRKVKCLCADDSAGSRVKVGHRQAIILEPPDLTIWGFLRSETPNSQAGTAMLQRRSGETRCFRQQGCLGILLREHRGNACSGPVDIDSRIIPAQTAFGLRGVIVGRFVEKVCGF